ncbi:MAG: single-stranded-DNA-specific exonuclease RecJ [Clostridia bacterium]|nr:single-stranded-DNA-specific exonuclease RecJ [Clostridia bacterium]
MSLSGKQWVWPDHKYDQVIDLAQNLNLPSALARLLINRGIEDPVQARAFLSPSADQFYPPWLMLGMEQAVRRLFKAISKNERIMIHGDYDADGIAASVIMVEALQQLGGIVDFFLPSRFDEGYGLHIDPLNQFRETGVTLVVTVDCGINAVEEVSHAAKIGLDLIVTDHHQPLGQLQGAVSVINPLQKNCLYPFKELSGAGVAFKLATALMEKSGCSFPTHLLDLAALGTAADVVPLLGENRVIVSAGLAVLRDLQRIGFKALAEAVNLDQDRINSTALSYILAPAVNAAGRMGEALPAAKLLLEKDAAKAADLAAYLHRTNQLRRATELKILKEAEEAALDLLATDSQGIITLAGTNWHHGVIGIVASRLVEKFNRPVAMIAIEGEEGRGSARSIPGFDITAALAENASLLERFGGHEQAAGFTIKGENIGNLRASLNQYARLNMKDKQFNARLYIEAELDEAEIDFDLTANLEQLQPFGTANPVPLFGSRGWEVKSWRLVGADQRHLKLKVQKGKRILSPIFFSGSDLVPYLEEGRHVDLAFKLKNGFFRNEKTLEVEIKDLSYSDCFSNSIMELIDRRGCQDRFSCLEGGILKQKEAQMAVFISTLSRLKKIEKSGFNGMHPCFITSGSFNNSPELPPELDTIVIYDLPLHEGILQPVFEKCFSNSPVTVYLLYSDDDLERNCLLLDHSLPTEQQLMEILTALVGIATENNDLSLPGPVAGILGFTPVPNFWERVTKIFTEIGLLENNQLSPDWKRIEESWLKCLDLSPTHLATRELRNNCEQFQKLLLEGSLEEIAARLNNLSGC